MNQVCLSGVLLRRDVIRYTPAGIPILTIWIGHESRQIEAGYERDVHCEVEAVAAAELAQQLESVSSGSLLEVSGFLSARNRHHPRLILHVQRVKLSSTN